METHPVKPFIVFHLSVGTRLALRKLAPILAVSFAYEKDVPVLVGIDLEFQPGLTMLLGPNGCGKSTLLKLASGVEKPNAGQITIDAHNLWQDEVAARQNLAYVPEQPDLTPYATIREILNLVCRLRNEPLEKGIEALQFFSLYDLATRTVRELSLGQRRRAVFAAALIGTPRYILLDEPLEGMDRKIKDDILSWIKGHVDAGAVVIVVSHTIEPFVEMTSQPSQSKMDRPSSIQKSHVIPIRNLLYWIIWQKE